MDMESQKIKHIINGNYFVMEKEIEEQVDPIIRFQYSGSLKIRIDNKDYEVQEILKKPSFLGKRNLVFEFNFCSKKLSFKEAEKLMKKIHKIGKIVKVSGVKIGMKQKDKTIVGWVISGNSEYENDVLTAIGVLICSNKKQKYEYLYDEICEELDKRVITKNVCDFKDNKCIAKRKTNCTMGCCHHFKNRYFGILYEKNMQLCEYQKDKKCTAKCISCKMYMCSDLRKKGYRFTCFNVLPIKIYFNLFQKLIIKTSFFTPKERILKRLLRFTIV